MFRQEVWKVSEAGSTDRGQSDTPNLVFFLGFTGDDGMYTLPFPRQSRRFLLVGDSFTFGSGTMIGMSPEYNCRTIPDYYPAASNYWSWGGILCRDLDAECHFIGRGGRGMYINADSTKFPRTLPHLFHRALATVSSRNWDHSRFSPDVVFITAGQNDFAPVKYASASASTRVMFLSHVSSGAAVSAQHRERQHHTGAVQEHVPHVCEGRGGAVSAGAAVPRLRPHVPDQAVLPPAASSRRRVQPPEQRLPVGLSHLRAATHRLLGPPQLVSRAL
jgi:hypothetical protein